MGLSPPTTPQTFYSAGVTQLRATQLSAEDYANAFNSLVAQDPLTPPATAASAASNVSTSLAYFTVSTSGQPLLVVPQTSPSFNPYPTTAPLVATAPAPAPAPVSGPVTVPAGQPCPQGFVTSGAAGTPGAGLGEIINGAFLQLPASALTTTTETTACKPAPTVTTVGEYITLDDFLQITVQTSIVTTGLTLSARILECDGTMLYMVENLDGVPINTPTRFIIPLTPGYLLDVAVSDQNGNPPNGAVFVAISLQHSSQTGLAPVSYLAQGYVTNLFGVAWPAATTGAPVQYPAPWAGQSTPALVQHKTNFTNGATSVAVTLTLAVTQGNSLIAFCMQRIDGGTHAISDNQGNSYTSIQHNVALDLFIATNVKGGFTTVTYNVGGVIPEHITLQVLEVSGIDAATPLDVVATNNTGGPTTSTTAATNHTDIAIAQVVAYGFACSALTVPAGWQNVEDTCDSASNHSIALINLTTSAPPATRSFTSNLTGFSSYVTIAALKIVGG